MLDPLQAMLAATAPQAPQAPRPTDPLLEQMLKVGVADDRAAALAPRLRRAQALSLTPMAEGYRVGGTYKAASPLEHLAAAMSRITGNRQMGDVEKELGGFADQKVEGRRAFAQNPSAFAGALSGDPAMGAAGQVFQHQQDNAAAAEAAASQARAAAEAKAAADAESARRWEAQQAETQRHNREGEGTDRARLAADAFGAVADPVTGKVIIYNKKTGQRLDGDAAPTPTASAPGAPLPGIPGKPSEGQRKAVLQASESVSQLDLAIDALKKAPGAYGGVGNFAAGVAESIGGTPAQSILARRYSPEELRAKNQISNVVSKIINERAGANVTLREELRQKFLPQDTDGYDQALQKLGDLRTMMTATYEAQGNGMVPPVASAPQAPAKALSAEDQQAAEWAKANPNDPRSARILRALGM